MDELQTTAGGIALVTGAGRGLGAGIARALARHGHAVAVNDVATSSEAAELSADLVAQGARSIFVGGDVTDCDQVPRIVDEVAAGLGSIDVVVANACGPQPVIDVSELTWSDVEVQLAYFVRSPLLLTQAVLPAMRAAGHGRIVLIGSDLVERAVPGCSAYAAAKAAMTGLTRTWASELGPLGITVNLVVPGWIPVERHADTSAAERDAYVSEVPLRRFGTPDEVGEVVAFLASDAASFVTGERVAVNGGHTLF